MTKHRRLANLAAGLLGLALVLAGAEAAPPDPPRRGEAPVTAGVFFATNRLREPGASGPEAYGGDRGVPAYGRCEVAFEPIPGLHQVTDKLPFYLPSEINSVRLAGEFAADDFWGRLETGVGAAGGSLVVFVHGYNYGFERTCRMASELQRNLGAGAAVLMFSWPANGIPTDYVRDQADVEWSVPFLAEFLATAASRLGSDRVQVLAHSLGTRGVLHALERMRADRVPAPAVGRLVLLAPDYDSQTFIERLPRIAGMVAEPITLYASENDTALKVSRGLSGYPRLGEGGPLLTLADGMESIDVSPAGRYQILGHEYFFYHPRVVSDLVGLLTTGEAAARRAGTRERRRDGRVFWEIGDAAP